ncbi:hypothetical protein [Mesorhizobium ventifaucium]|nr:hypothetical protein [Mesorhizobium ventifaucium]
MAELLDHDHTERKDRFFLAVVDARWKPIGKRRRAALQEVSM